MQFLYQNLRLAYLSPAHTCHQKNVKNSMNSSSQRWRWGLFCYPILTYFYFFFIKTLHVLRKSAHMYNESTIWVKSWWLLHIARTLFQHNCECIFMYSNQANSYVKIMALLYLNLSPQIGKTDQKHCAKLNSLVNLIKNQKSCRTIQFTGITEHWWGKCLLLILSQSRAE